MNNNNNNNWSPSCAVSAFQSAGSFFIHRNHSFCLVLYFKGAPSICAGLCFRRPCSCSVLFFLLHFELFKYCYDSGGLLFDGIPSSGRSAGRGPFGTAGRPSAGTIASRPNWRRPGERAAGVRGSPASSAAN